MNNLRSIDKGFKYSGYNSDKDINKNQKQKPRKSISQSGDVFIRYNGVEHHSTHQKQAPSSYIGYDRHLAQSIDSEPVSFGEALKKLCIAIFSW
jgi:hypothetical protein